MSDLDEAQKLQPGNADVYLARGEVEQALANYDASLLDFESFSKRASKDPRGLIASGVVLEAMGRPQEALAAYESAVAIAPDNNDAIAGRDRLRAQQNGGDPSKKEDDKKENDQPK